MSNLLNAIRKSEQQRQHESVPSLDAIVNERRARRTRRRTGWLIPLAILIAVGVGYFYRADIVPRAQGYYQQYLQPLMQKANGLVANTKEKLLPSDVTSSTNAATQSQPALEDATNTAAISNNVRALLSQLKFSVLSYSADSDRRFAVVGGVTVREGDQLEGFNVMRIQADGVVLDVRGTPVLVRP